VATGPVAEIPRFELTFDTLFWITPEGVYQRDVSDPATAVLLARTWTLSGPPEGIGWVPHALDSADAPLQRQGETEDPPTPPRALVDDVWFGAGIRFGRPVRSSIGGMGSRLGVRRGWAMAELVASSRTVSLHFAELEAYRQAGELQVDDTRYGVGLHVGPTTGPQRIGPFSAEATLLTGTELQQYLHFRLSPSETEADPPRWDFGAQFGAGTELRVSSVGLRGTAVLDVRPRSGAWTRTWFTTVALVLHP
jgi:hypothetical protein